MVHEIGHLREDNRMLLARYQQQLMGGQLILQRPHSLVWQHTGSKWKRGYGSCSQKLLVSGQSQGITVVGIWGDTSWDYVTMWASALKIDPRWVIWSVDKIINWLDTTSCIWLCLTILQIIIQAAPWFSLCILKDCMIHGMQKRISFYMFTSSMPWCFLTHTNSIKMLWACHQHREHCCDEPYHQDHGNWDCNRHMGVWPIVT